MIWLNPLATNSVHPEISKFTMIQFDYDLLGSVLVHSHSSLGTHSMYHYISYFVVIQFTSSHLGNDSVCRTISALHPDSNLFDYNYLVNNSFHLNSI